MADTKKPARDLPPDDPPSLGRTVRLPSAPRPSVRAQTIADISLPLVPRAAKVPTAGTSGAGVELVVIDETQVAGGERKPWRAAEVWTKRRVYGLDSTFRCVEVLDRETGRPDLTNDMLGGRLGGGRLRETDTVRFSYPLPLPGMEAMFMKARKHGYTSAVERMIVRIRVLHTAADEAMPSWDEIASRWSEPPSR